MAKDTQTDILQDLKKKYKKQALSIQEVANELGVSIGTMRVGIKAGVGIPPYKNIGMGTSRKKYAFPIYEFAKFLSDTQLIH